MEEDKGVGTRARTSLPYLVAALFLGSCWGYFLLEPGDGLFLQWSVVFSIQFLFYLTTAVLLWKWKSGSTALWVLTGILARALLWFSEPVLESDFYRYLWDGHVLAQGINPYLYAPLDPALDGIDTLYRVYIGWPQFSTIYPPVAQYLFALSNIVAPGSLLSLKVIFTLFDIATGLLLIRWLAHLKIDTRWSLLYFLNPLVLKEVANSAHLDPIPVFLSFAAVYVLGRSANRRDLPAWLLLGLAVGAKIYPLVLIPFFIKLDRKWKTHIAVFTLLLLAIYLPFIGAGARLFSGTASYARHWIFNASVFEVTTGLFNHVLLFVPGVTESSSWQQVLSAQLPAKLFLGLVYLIAVVWRARKLISPEDLAEAVLWALGLLLILSPVVDGWYVLWLLPFACLLRHVPWLSFSFLVVAAYSWFYSRDLALGIRTIEYAVFYGLLLWWSLRRRTAKPLP